MLNRVRVIGLGRAGRAIHDRLAERGLTLTDEDPELVLLCVPDANIAEVAAGIRPGPWIAHVSGATMLSALDPHVRRFSVHPLQTLVRGHGPDQLDGGWAAISAESPDALEEARDLAERLGLRPFEIGDADRAIYHAAAVIGGNFLVTLHRAATELLEAVGAPPEAIVPLMRRTIENGFELTGPIARGDTATVDAHVAALEARAPHLVTMYRALAEATHR